eukprot:s5194_g2.t1
MAQVFKRLMMVLLMLSTTSLSMAEWDDESPCSGQTCDETDTDEEVLFQMSAVVVKQGQEEPDINPGSFDEFEALANANQEQVLRLRVDIADFDLGGFLGPALEAAGLPCASDFRSDALSLSGAAGCLGPAERLEELWRTASEFQSSGTWPPVRLGACAKHLCGGATDIALRSLKDKPHRFRAQGFLRNSASQSCLQVAQEAQRQPLKPGPCFGVCIATCCHHRCDPKSYVNRPFLADLGLCQSPEDEFSQFVSTAGWAVGGDGARDVEKRRVGMMAKRILDLGRELQLGDATLTDYIDKAVTPENIAILAGAHAGHKTRAGVWGLRWLACCGWCR